jgi:ketosteroid isomerase-like protein
MFFSDGRPLLEAGFAEAAARMGSDLGFVTGNVYMSDFNAQIYGDVAVATFYLVGTHARGGETRRGTWRVTAVWVREGDEWKEAHHHESPLSRGQKDSGAVPSGPPHLVHVWHR